MIWQNRPSQQPRLKKKSMNCQNQHQSIYNHLHVQSSRNRTDSPKQIPLLDVYMHMQRNVMKFWRVFGSSLWCFTCYIKMNDQNFDPNSPQKWRTTDPPKQIPTWCLYANAKLVMNIWWFFYNQWYFMPSLSQHHRPYKCIYKPQTSPKSYKFLISCGTR